MELVKSYKGYTITINGAKVSAVNGTDFIILSIQKIKNKSNKYINNFIYRAINHRIKYLDQQTQ